MPEDRGTPIALVGAGGIAPAHLDAYRTAGFNVRVIANRTLARAVERRDAFFPQAEATDDIAGTLARPDIAVVDLTPHPAERAPMIEAALRAGKHVLSQKPFVLDLDTGERLADLAATQGRMLAVNQNGRWAPHLSWMREAVRAGLVGEVQSVHLSVHWDHSWIAGTAVRADRRPDPLRFRDPLVRLPRQPHRRLRHPRDGHPQPRRRPDSRAALPQPDARRVSRRPGRRSCSTRPPATARSTAPSSPAASARSPATGRTLDSSGSR